MDKKSKIILILLVITLLSLSSYASLSRFSKGINKEGSIQTTEMEYCKLNEIETLSECLIRNDSKQELSLALNTIDDRTNNASDQSGLYKGEDDYTIDSDTYTYYYQGEISNNWVKYGNSLWRVVRINGNGTIRMIYSGLESSDHTGRNAQIGLGGYSKQNSYNVTFPRLVNSNDLRTLSYTNGTTNLTYVGYMYNPNKVVKTFPDKTLSNQNGYTLNSFPTYDSISETESYYFFKNFDPEEDCYLGDGTDDSGTCVLKCNKLGNYGDVDADCVYSTWADLITNPLNYSTTAPGSTSNAYVYQMSSVDGGYRYTCLNGTNTEEFLEGDVYSTCPTIMEIVGVIKDRPKSVRIKIHSIFSENAETSNTNIADSNVKQLVDSWYENNILNQKDANDNYLEDYLADSVFCGDRSSNDAVTFPLSSTGSSNYVFNVLNRNISTVNPSFKCLKTDGTFNVNDAFTLKTSNALSRVEPDGIGNNMLKYPVGLITVDEVSFAGGRYSLSNNKYYLYTGQSYWTMSPAVLYMASLGVRNFFVSNNGNVSYTSLVYGLGIRPVINLKSDILYKGGDGTENNPYIIDINN